MEMRKAFCNYMLSAMAQDKRLCVLDADLGNADGTLPLRKEFPDRAFDVGIARTEHGVHSSGLVVLRLRAFHYQLRLLCVPQNMRPGCDILAPMPSRT